MIILISALFCSQIAEATEILITNTGGKAFYKKHPSDWTIASPGTSLTKNDALKTGARSFAELRLDEDNRFRLMENTEMSISALYDPSKLPEGKLIRLVNINIYKGGIGARLKRLPAGVRVDIEGPSAVASSLGTGFIVSSDGEISRTSVSVLEERVVMKSREKADRSIVVTPFKQVDIMPWKTTSLQVKGSGILPASALKDAGIRDTAGKITIAAEASGKTREAAKDASLVKLGDRVYNIKLNEEKTVGDIAYGDNLLASRLMERLSRPDSIKYEREQDGSFRARVEIGLSGIEEIIGLKITTVSLPVIQISLEEYSRRFGPQNRLMARRAAVVDSLRRLAESIYGVTIDSKTTVRDFAVKSDVIRLSVEGIVRGAKVIGEEYYSDGSVTVTSFIPGEDVFSGLSSVRPDIDLGHNYISAPMNLTLEEYMFYRGF